MRLGRLSKFVSPIQFAGIACVVLFWFAYGANQALGNRWGAYLRQPSRPPLLNGLELPTSFFKERPALSSADARYLLLISSDTCQYSEAESRNWISFLREATFRPTDRVWLITTNGARIPQKVQLVLKERGISHEIIQVADQTAFTQGTGIAWTPATVLLDSNFAVRLSAEQLSPSISQLIRVALSSGRPSL